MVPILANTITADMGLIPGLAIISPLFGLPLSVMAAVIERPFLSAAGLRRHTVWYSIQANFLSLLIGYPLVIVIAMLTSVFSYGLLAVWPFAAVAISTWIENTFIHWRADLSHRLSFGWVLGGNAVSALTCILLLVPVNLLDRQNIKDALRPFQLSFSIILGVFCVAAVVVAFVIPLRRRNLPPGNVPAVPTAELTAT